MFFLASFKAASGVASPFVAISNAAFIELQNLPICGMLGITTPFRAFSYVPLINGFAGTHLVGEGFQRGNTKRRFGVDGFQAVYGAYVFFEKLLCEIGVRARTVYERGENADEWLYPDFPHTRHRPESKIDPAFAEIAHAHGPLTIVASSPLLIFSPSRFAWNP